MAIISYPTEQLVDKYLQYSNQQNIGADLGSTRKEPGFTVVDISSIPKALSIYPCNKLCQDAIIGVDYPCLVAPDSSDIKSESQDGIGKTIAIIGQDPRRSTSDKWYKNPNTYFRPQVNQLSFPNDVIFGLPWAVNVDGYPHVQAVSKHLVDKLLARGFKIYFTDVFKFYKSCLGRSNFADCMSNAAVASDALTLLFDELNAVKPDKILVFGEQPFKQFQNYCNQNINFQQYLGKLVTDKGGWVKHPAGRQWGKGYNDSKKAEFYNSLI